MIIAVLANMYSFAFRPYYYDNKTGVSILFVSGILNVSFICFNELYCFVLCLHRLSYSYLTTRSTRYAMTL